MKALFEDDFANLIIGREGENLTVEIEMTSSDEPKRKVHINIDQLVDLEHFIHKMVVEIEDEQRKKLPFWKRLW